MGNSLLLDKLKTLNPFKDDKAGMIEHGQNCTKLDGINKRDLITAFYVTRKEQQLSRKQAYPYHKCQAKLPFLKILSRVSNLRSCWFS